MPEVPDSLRFTDQHEWLSTTEGGTYRLRITDHAQEELGDIVFVGDLPEVGDKFEQGDVVAVVESTKTASDIYAPVGGTVTAVNEELREDPERVNRSPYKEGWFVEFKVVGKPDLDELLTAEQYRQLLSHS